MYALAPVKSCKCLQNNQELCNPESSVEAVEWPVSQEADIYFQCCLCFVV